MEAIGLISAIIGRMTAILNRRRIVEIRHVSAAQTKTVTGRPVTIVTGMAWGVFPRWRAVGQHYCSYRNHGIAALDDNAAVRCE